MAKLDMIASNSQVQATHLEIMFFNFINLLSTKFLLTDFIMIVETYMATASILGRLILSSLNNLQSSVPRSKIHFAVRGI